MYRTEDTIALQDKHSVAGITTVRTATWIPIDVDKGDNTDEQVLLDARNVLSQLTYLGLDVGYNCNIWFSGSGYHIDIHADCFGIEPSEDYPFMIKRTIKKMLPNVDFAVYMRTSIIRCPFSRNDKNGRYKIFLTYEEIMQLPYQQIHAMASSLETVKNRIATFLTDQEENPREGNNELYGYVNFNVPKIRQIGDVIEPRNVVSCIYSILQEGAIAGSRNNKIMRIASFCKRSGISSEIAKLIILDWNNKSLNENTVIEKIEYTYNKGYMYGCSDNILQQYCSGSCSHFKRKDLTLAYRTADSLQAELLDKTGRDTDGLTIDLGAMLGIPPVLDCAIQPGELVTIIGGPGSNKSTFVQNIALGLNFVTAEIDQTKQIPCVIFTPELAPHLTHRRNLQMVSGKSKKDLQDMNILRKAYKESKSSLDHIKIVSSEIWLENIEQTLVEQKVKLIIIDYAELIHIEGERPTTKAYDKLPKILPKLSSIAVEKDIIIILVSQSDRTDAKNQDIGLHSGFGSAAIEKSSRKVITVTGKADERDRRIKMVKNQDGDIFDVNLEVLESYRLRVVMTPEQEAVHARQQALL